MAHSLKVVLRKKANANGTYPLAIRITVDRKSSYIHLGKNLRETEWDSLEQKVKKNHPNSSRLNSFIRQKLTEIDGKFIDLATQNKVISSNAVRKQVKTKQANSFFCLQMPVWILCADKESITV